MAIHGHQRMGVPKAAALLGAANRNSHITPAISATALNTSSKPNRGQPTRHQYGPGSGDWPLSTDASAVG